MDILTMLDDIVKKATGDKAPAGFDGFAGFGGPGESQREIAEVAGARVEDEDMVISVIAQDEDADDVVAMASVLAADPEDDGRVSEPPALPAAPATTATPESADVMIPPEMAYKHGGMRFKLICEGVCTHCCHCGHKLTDAESIQMGIGPTCKKTGYTDDIPVTDDTEALLALAEFPVLVEYLTKKYRPKGNRALVNGLVRTASLNRRTPVHAACCDAVEALGYKRLASALRESIAVVEISDEPGDPSSLSLWVRKSDFNWGFWNKLKAMRGVHMVRVPKLHTLVPKEHRKALGRLLVEHYAGLCVKTPKGAFKISEAWFSGKTA